MSITSDYAALLARLEPGCNILMAPARDMAALSAAISFKRLADILTDPSLALTHHAEHLAWAAGRSFEQGRRTDR